MEVKLAILLGATSGGAQASNAWIPDIEEINLGFITLISIASFVLLVFKIRSVRKQSKLKDLEIFEKELDILEKEKELKEKYGDISKK